MRGTEKLYVSCSHWSRVSSWAGVQSLMTRIQRYPSHLKQGCVLDRSRSWIGSCAPALSAPCTPWSRSAPYTLHPTPCNLHPTPCNLHPTPCNLHPTPCNLRCWVQGLGFHARHGAGPSPTPYTLHSTPYTRYPALYTLHSLPFTLHPAPRHARHGAGPALGVGCRV